MQQLPLPGGSTFAAGAAAFPAPNPSASLLLSHKPPPGKLALIIGTGKLAASRSFACLEAGIRPVILSEHPLDSPLVCDELRFRVHAAQLTWKLASIPDESSCASLLDELDEGDSRSLFIVCVTDTLHIGQHAAADARAQLIVRLCRRRRIPINVADRPELCDFSFPATYRFPSTHSSALTSLQVAVTTNGRGCRLAGRIRRDIVAALPRNVGDAVEKVGRMRDLAKHEDNDAVAPTIASKRRKAPSTLPEEEDLSFDTTPLNSPVPQLLPKNPLDKAALKLNKALHSPSISEEEQSKIRQQEAERTKRRMRWVAQISEYWPIEYLGALRQEQLRGLLDTYAEPASATSQLDSSALLSAATQDHDNESRGRPATPTSSSVPTPRARSQHALDIRPPVPTSSRKQGHIFLLGSGPGHPGLLTVFAHRLLTSPETHLVLSDKLVPASILRLIPSSTPLEIAKKFPGNAEGAQSELIALALRAALEQGKNVVRLKQGDPFIYGRGGEEVLAFRRAGIECTVVPGISSAIAAPLLLGIPVTQRGAADSLVLATGVGRGGKQVQLPIYERSRTLILLMGVARLPAVIETLTHECGFPSITPIAVIERASSADQRMVASTLDGIVTALERAGEQRPPGMIVIGWSVLSLHGEGDTTISDQPDDAEKDQARIRRWVGERGYIIREGLDDAYRSFLNTSTTTATPESTRELEASRSDSGWAPARYPDGKPEGGWVADEAPNRPATDTLAYEQDQEYAALRARLASQT